MHTTAYPQSESYQVAAPWGVGKRVTFRFFAVYLVLYHLNPVLGVFSQSLQQTVYRWPLRSLDGWLAINVFGLDPAVLRLGWGGNTDMPLHYIHVLVLLVFAAVATVAWSVFDRHRLHYQPLHAWVRLLVRYSLASSLLWYGFSKVFVGQMAPAWMYLERLVEPFGDMSPAGLLWAFVGYSAPYQIFGGLAEVFAGLLLLFRRTTTLGALVAIGVLLNVDMLNFSYQVDVKLASVNMLLSAVFLAAPDLAKLTRFFVLNQRVDPPDASDPVVENQWSRIALLTFKAVFVFLILYGSLSSAYRNALFRPQPNQPVLSGLYDVETFILNGYEHPPLITDSARWRHVIIGDSPTVMRVQMMDASFRRYTTEYDKEGRTISLILGNDKEKKYVLECSRPDRDRVIMEGTLGDDALTVRMKRIDPWSFSLLNSPFKWTGRTDIH